jgi:hypothetical protein
MTTVAELNDAADTLTRARQQITPIENWNRGARWDYESRAMCALGVIGHAKFGSWAFTNDTDLSLEVQLLSESCADLSGRAAEKVAAFNNAHVHQEVLALFDATIARARRRATILELERESNAHSIILTDTLEVA